MKEQIIKVIIDSLGMLEDTEGHGYKLHIYNGEWWISHNVVGSGEPVRQWLKRELDRVEVAKIKATPMPMGWICPRCHKVHNWMVQHCDCPPKVITASTTEPKEVTEIKGENNCNNCIWGKCLTADWPCFDCDGSNKWEPIKTE